MIDTNKVLSSDYLDILFEGRNKQYGSYELRKQYPARMRNALMYGLSIVSIAIIIPIVVNAFKPTEEERSVLKKTTEISSTPLIIPDKPQALAQLPKIPKQISKPTLKISIPIIEKDKNVKQEDIMPAIADIKNSVPGIKKENGSSDGTEISLPSPNGSSGTGLIESHAHPSTPFIIVEQMPVPSGDINEYLGKNIKYPEVARENNIQGKVLIQFIINEDGTLSDLKIVRNIGGGCDEEALRVVAAMPKWKPGKQNGKNVKVQFTLPIYFKLE